MKKSPSVVIAEIAAEHLGSYLRTHNQQHEGYYLSYRRSFDNEHRIICTRCKIFWDSELSGLRFIEKNRIERAGVVITDYEQLGEIHISAAIGLVHILTSFKGAVRLVTLSRLIDENKNVMKGLIATQYDVNGKYHVPATSPLYMMRQDVKHNDIFLDSGTTVFEVGDPEYEQHANILAEIEKGDVSVFATSANLRQKKTDGTCAFDINDRKRIAEAIQKEIMKNNMTEENAAIFATVDRKTLRKILCAETSVRPLTIKKTLEAFGLSLF